MADSIKIREARFRDRLVEEGSRAQTTRAFVGLLCQGLVDHGIPVDRALVSVRTIHPQVMATGYLWNAGHEVIAVDRGYDIVNAAEYLNSPFRMIHDGEDIVRRSLAGPDAVLDMPLMRDLATEGFTDYIGIAYVMSDGTRNAISFSTKSADGFRDDQIAFLRTLMPIVSVVLDRQSVQRIAQTLLDTYVGHHAGERILRGEIRRGQGQRIQAVIWYGDLRNFTAMSDSLPTDEDGERRSPPWRPGAEIHR